jgi:hypothetical protein
MSLATVTNVPGYYRMGGHVRRILQKPGRWEGIVFVDRNLANERTKGRCLGLLRVSNGGKFCLNFARASLMLAL